MNYQLFSGFSASQIASSKTFINYIIDQNYKQTILDSEKQSDYDNLKSILTALNLASASIQPVVLRFA